MTIAFTIWWNDLVQLDMWLKYYSQHFDELYVMCCATKEEYIPKLEERKKTYNFFYEKFDEGMISVEKANIAIREKQTAFLTTHDWVLFTNCDEIVCADPRKFKDLRDFMSKSDKDWTPCEGFEILRQPEEPPFDYTKPLIPQRKYWVKDVNYNKIILSKVPLEWNEGQHQISGIIGETSKAYKNTGLYLLHFKYADSMDGRDLGPFKSLGEPGFKDKDKVKTPEWIRGIV